MNDLVVGGISLQRLDHRLRLFPTHLHGQDMREECLVLHLFAQSIGLQRNRHRILASPIHHGGHDPGSTQAPVGPLAQRVARFGDDFEFVHW